MAKAIIWCRVSTTEQEFESQKTELIISAKQEGFTEEDMIIIGEAGASAIKMNELYQREVNQLITAIHTIPEITTIFVWEVSRLARNELAFAQMKDTILKKHIQLICRVPQLRLFDDNGELNTGADITLNLLITLARQEMEIKAKRFARGRKRLADEGKYNGGAIPYGYKIDRDDDGRIVEDEEEGAIVREIFDLYERGYSQMRIAKELFERGIKGRAVRKTKRFTLSLVHQILTNELLTGVPHKNKGASYVRMYPMIITPAQFARCREIAKKNNKVQPKSAMIYYAHALIKCTECGRNFVSTGYKGYYHCQDAYNYTKKYDGYFGVPKCPNRVCISCNVMDSLLWYLAIEYETLFILNDAQQTLNDSKKQREIVQQKLDAIPQSIAEIEQRRQRLHLAFVNGLNEENYNRTREELSKEEKRVQATAADYKSQIQHYDSLIKEVQHNLDIDYDFTHSQIMDYLDKMETIKERVAGITDDRERSDIIHKHIKKVSIEKTKIVYKFDIAPDGKETSAKKIEVYTYLSAKPETYFFIPNDGKGGTMLKQNAPSGTITDPITGHTTIRPEYHKIVVPYLRRITDKKKAERRQEARSKKKVAAEAKHKEMKEMGFVSMPEMKEISGMSYATLYDAIAKHKMTGIKVERVWFVQRSSFNEYLNKYKPKPRPLR